MRGFASTALLASFIALTISGVFMMLAPGLLEQTRMHPLHNVFAFILVIAGCIHLLLNLEPLIGYMKKGSIKIFSAVMALMLIGLLTAGMQKTVPAGVKTKVRQIEVELRGLGL